ncbi:MAG: WXG100 family type VII secretion target [Bacilli bacterium]|nr:WXG100 family type VII secretion target [Bacilli bacterium]
MKGKISVDPATLSSYGSHVNQLGSDYTTEINAIYATIEDLKKGWTGEAATTFNTTVKGYEQELKKLGTTIQDLGTDLGTIAGIYTQQELENAEAAGKL